jgi:hypothetical protein
VFNAIFSLSLFALAIANPGAAITGATIWYLGNNGKPGKSSRKNKEEETLW